MLTDGFGGLSLLEVLLDDPVGHRPRRPTRGADPARDDGARNEGEEAGDTPPAAVPVTFDLAQALRPLALGLTAALGVDPRQALSRQLRRGIDVASSLSRQVLASGDRRSSLPPSRTPISRFEILSVPYARAAALDLGGSRNDLVVAGVATGVGRYLDLVGRPADELRLAVSVRRRHPRGGPHNSFSPVLVDLPARTTHPGPHFGVVAERLERARKEPALGLAAALAPSISRLPAVVLGPALHAQADGIDFVATALPGLRGTHRLCGATIEESYPFGPRFGCPLNVTGFGNGGGMDLGISLSPTAVTEPELLLECLEGAFAELTAQFGGEAPRPAPAAVDGGAEPGTDTPANGSPSAFLRHG